mmetsp:Transcript_20493/g.30354  ORF Transcript_20493/g.30354 Transcript_20493/m.30354 type:complete len:81 (-) Transcript_20493:36-278(-)
MASQRSVWRHAQRNPTVGIASSPGSRISATPTSPASPTSRPSPSKVRKLCFLSSVKPCHELVIDIFPPCYFGVSFFQLSL